ncbi:SGNH/GDSL hydrolase family protein [Paenibacillus chitinolyticus]
MTDTRTILCFGDSNTWGADPQNRGVRFPADVRWTGVLRKELGEGYDIVEEGLPGRTTVWTDPIDGIMSGKEYLTSCLLSHRPLDLVVIMLGTNDLKERFSVSALDIAMSTLSLAGLVKTTFSRPGITIVPQVLILVPPPIKETGLFAGMFKGGEEKSKQLSEAFAMLSPYTDASIMDASTVIVSSDADGIHFEAEQHLKLGSAVAEKIKSMLVEE